jgi:hypothetical protein
VVCREQSAAEVYYVVFYLKGQGIPLLMGERGLRLCFGDTLLGELF